METQHEIRKIDSYQPELISLLFSRLDGMNNITPNKKFFESANNILLVSFSNETPTGFLYAYILDDVKSKRPMGILYSIDVYKDYRRIGVAQMLVGELKAIAKRNNCRRIFVITDAENIPAINLYQKTGAKSSTKDDVVMVFDQNHHIQQGL